MPVSAGCDHWYECGGGKQVEVGVGGEIHLCMRPQKLITAVMFNASG